MRKVYLAVSFIWFIFLLQGCTVFIIEEKSLEYQQLSNQYNEYVVNDGASFEDFSEIMNKATNITTTSVFMVETQVKDFIGRVISHKSGTGILIYTDANYYYVLTIFDVIDSQSNSTEYYVTDAFGNKVEAKVFSSDETSTLGVVRFSDTREDYIQVDFADYMPLNGELMIMISNSFPTQNIQKLGLYHSKDDISYVDLLSNQNASGSPVFNLQLELVGIQFTYTDTEITLIDYKAIHEYISRVLPI